MVKIIWHDNATFMLGYHLEYARIEFGESTMKRWKTEVAAFEERVRQFPESYPPEALLKDKPVVYRFRHLMNKRFKLIYFYDESESTIHVIDIWDSKMSPETLIKRIR